jgi:hypothetical protein
MNSLSLLPAQKSAMRCSHADTSQGNSIKLLLGQPDLLGSPVQTVSGLRLTSDSLTCKIESVRKAVKNLIHIVGCNHGIQVGMDGFAALDSAEENEQRAHFRALLETICEEQAIQIVLEEDGGLEETASEQIAAHRNIPWTDINTSNEDKTQMDIPIDYVTGPYSEQQKINWHHQRELFMVGKINEHRSGGESLLIICGFVHMQPLTDILGQDGTSVQQWDYRNIGWYVPGVFVGDY